MTKSVGQFLFLIILFPASLIAQNMDINLMKSINENESSFKNCYFKVASQTVTVVNIATPAGLFVAGLLKHDNELKKKAVYMAGGFIVSTMITHATKRIVKRTRPFEEYPFIEKRDVGGGYSFPSGHTSAAFTTATSISLYYPKWYVIVPAYLWAGSVGYARMYQGVHYPSDVLAGAFVGAASAWLSYKAQQWIEKKYKQKTVKGY